MKLGRAGACAAVALVLAIAASGGCGGGGNKFGEDPDASAGGNGNTGDNGGNTTGVNGGANSGDNGGNLNHDGGGNGGGDDSSTGYNDATPDVDFSDGQCTNVDAGPPPLPQRCAPATQNECAIGGNDTDAFLTTNGVAAALLNGATGNGFDDDCDGLVDEGCSCPSAGKTKDCYLVPATQADANTKLPVGWCTTNSKGSLACAGAEFPAWDGTCRGAQPPYAHDVCAPGDFNCDGVPQNSDTQDCSCHTAVVTCPTAPIVEAPYPAPTTIKAVDGTSWIAGGQAANATGWKWTVLGGDCDNILPHPTFALYNNTNSTVGGARIGTRTSIKYDAAANPPEYVSTANQPLWSIQASTGNGAAGGVVYPAFGLSGDYIVQGEFDLSGTHYVCTQQVQVRAPGIRAELCWDSVGGGESSNGAGNDIDLHFARLQGTGTDCSTHGWEETCTYGDGTYEDCWYSPSSGCRDGSVTGPSWGYSDSAQSVCIGGWSSRRAKPVVIGQGCTNPRLDKDNVQCSKTNDDPTSAGNGATTGFCGPENINLDNPKNGDRFIVGVNHYGNHGGTSTAHPHVNLYCNGVRVLSAGYNPVSGVVFPVLDTSGADSSGDEWTVATLQWDTAAAQGCDTATIPSHPTIDAVRDGTTDVCVDSKASNAPYKYTTHQFSDSNGAIPGTAAGFCKH